MTSTTSSSNPAAAVTRPGSSEIHLWSFNLDALGSPLPVLSPGEQARAARFVHSRDRIRFSNAHTALRHILGKYLACAPQSLDFSTTSFGKPSLAGAESTRELAFNLSHSGPHGVLAIAEGREVGVDVEVQRPANDLEGLVSQIATAAETRDFYNQPRELRVNAFFDLWVRKESLLKAMGCGLMVDPRLIQVGPRGFHSPIFAADRCWTVVDVEFDSSCSLAVAAEGTLDRLRCYQFRL
jgi:4'-phosphopantetheinyl transferase